MALAYEENKDRSRDTLQSLTLLITVKLATLISALLSSDVPSNIQLNSSFTIYIFITLKTVYRLKDLLYPHEKSEYII